MADDGEIRFTRGVPTDEELAAIVGVLMLRNQAPQRACVGPPRRWARSARPSYAHPDGRPVRPGPTAWRASALPR